MQYIRTIDKIEIVDNVLRIHSGRYHEMLQFAREEDWIDVQKLLSRI